MKNRKSPGKRASPRGPIGACEVEDEMAAELDSIELQRLQVEAGRRGLSVDALAAQLVERDVSELASSAARVPRRREH